MHGSLRVCVPEERFRGGGRWKWHKTDSTRLVSALRTSHGVSSCVVSCPSCFPGTFRGGNSGLRSWESKQRKTACQMPRPLASILRAETIRQRLAVLQALLRFEPFEQAVPQPESFTGMHNVQSFPYGLCVRIMDKVQRRLTTLCIP